MLGLVGGVWTVTQGTGPVESLRRAVAVSPTVALGLIFVAGCTLLALWGAAHHAFGQG